MESIESNSNPEINLESPINKNEADTSKISESKILDSEKPIDESKDPIEEPVLGKYELDLLNNMDSILSKEHLKDDFPDRDVHKKNMDIQLELAKVKEGISDGSKLPKSMQDALKKMQKSSYKEPKAIKVAVVKPQKINAKREQVIAELILTAQSLKMDPAIYNVAFFNSKSDEELMQWRLDIYKTIDKKMQINVTDSVFLGEMIVTIAKIAERIAPRYLKGYSSELAKQQVAIGDCISQMGLSGNYSILQKMNDPFTKLCIILGGGAIQCVDKNMTKGRNEIKESIEKKADEHYCGCEKKLGYITAAIITTAGCLTICFFAIIIRVW